MNQKVHIVKSVGELLFEGYEDKLMNIARSMPFLADSNMPEMDKFGWFYGVSAWGNTLWLLLIISRPNKEKCQGIKFFINVNFYKL